MTHAALLALGCAALAVALIAVGLVVWLIFATRSARDTAHRHDRRRRDEGPPAGQPERRHRSPDDARARRRDEDDPQWRVEHVVSPQIIRTDRPQDVRADDPAYPEPEFGPSTPSGSSSANPPTYPPYPAARHRSPDDAPETVEHPPPTTDMRTLPPPGAINR
jgi:hypothetical protein